MMILVILMNYSHSFHLCKSFFTENSQKNNLKFEPNVGRFHGDAGLGSTAGACPTTTPNIASTMTSKYGKI